MTGTRKKNRHKCVYDQVISEIRHGKAHFIVKVYACHGCGLMGDCVIDYFPGQKQHFVELKPVPSGSTIRWPEKKP